MKILNTKTMSSDRIKMLVFGLAGIGKTSLAKTIGEPTLIISAEAGLLCLKDSDIDVIDITLDDNGNVIPKEKRIARLSEVYQYLQTQGCKDKYKWIFIDSITEISQNLIEALNVEYPDKSSTLMMYGENAKRLRSIIKSFRDLPEYNVVMTALAEVEKDENGRRYMGISLVGNFSQKVSAFFDEVFYYGLNKEGERMLVTSGIEQTKDRSGKLNQQEKPNLASIKEQIICHS